jgi:hypothetical protein
MHLECNRDPSPSCLEWSEICDGKIDCLDTHLDGKYCWQLEIPQCDENEYQCSNGQCISLSSFRDDSNISDCLDQSDEHFRNSYLDSGRRYLVADPSFQYEDRVCMKRNHMSISSTPLTSSCVNQRENLLSQAMFSIKPESLSNECWTAMKYIMKMSMTSYYLCFDICIDGTCDRIIAEHCPDLIRVPAIPVLFGFIYIGYKQEHADYFEFRPATSAYICYNHHRFQLNSSDEPVLSLFNKTCHRYLAFGSESGGFSEPWLFTFIYPLYKTLWTLLPLTD